MCDEIIEETKTISTCFNNKKVTYETKKFYILLALLLITIAVSICCYLINYQIILIAVSICCYLINYQAKQKHLLPYHVTNNKLRKSFVLIIYHKNGE